ncbi:ThuA domain-containing protein [Acuticoccus sp. M5D2P5]|uniref:ThuA domain-containing protein n=1 Tax=Acuticoccus kalidii TaxID=2910977 RepID=UPI001F2EEC0C|nr:ThuA domain-containing protein [Acuticoccus kalidii]MCF3934860.1 ThuA domain-containing protein [Acuticoccus kalidii]
MTNEPRILVWNEFRHERENPAVAAHYGEGIHTVLAAALTEAGYASVGTATLDEPEHGLAEARLAETDVLLWWGHRHHDAVSDAVATRVVERVQRGMGLIVLHSGHYSKVFKRLMGTPCSLNWRADGERERVWVVKPEHPIAAGLGRYFEIAQEEMYGEVFEIPEPDELVFLSWFEGGEVFRSGCCYTRGRGRIFYFQPGHETFPTYHDAHVRRVIANAVGWARPDAIADPFANVRRDPLSPLASGAA